MKQNLLIAAPRLQLRAKAQGRQRLASGIF
jgi:hypothetical protein